MIAEDEAIIRLDLKELLEEEGYEVVGETGRGDEAIELVRELVPDLVILDVKMPGLDGLSAARQIASERLAAVLILTAFSQRDLVEQARDAGALAYLVKPFQKSDLIPAIEVALARHAELTSLERHVGDLEERLEARKVIDRAKGRLMDEHGLDEHAAWRFIQTEAMSNRVKVRRDRPARRRRRAGPVTDRWQCRKAPRATGPAGPPRAYHRPRCRSSSSSTATRSRTGPSTRSRPTWRRRDGTITNAVFGFTSMLTKVLADEKPDYIAVAFDTPAPTFRDEMDPEYKAGRKETPDVFRSQMPLIREVLDALKIPVLEIEGVEADDVIATLATQAADEGTDVVVVTGDRDTFQLVRDPHLKVLYNKRGVSDYALYDEAGIIERTRRDPGAVPRLRGAARRHERQPARRPGHRREDRSEARHARTATLEAIFEHLDELPPKQRENLDASAPTGCC